MPQNPARRRRPSSSSQETVLVIPCYNEEHRIQEEALRQLARAPRVRLVLVDDGSSDGTRRRLEELARAFPERMAVKALARNSGKAEAVRAGLLAALEDPAVAVVGYADADMATPPSELLRLVREMEGRPEKVLLGSRIRRLGSHIERNPVRHVVGRVFATAASLALQLPVYDTQCGAKLLRATPALREALSKPFTSRWAFDVELISRLLCASEPYSPEDLVEIPLLQWVDVGGSKVRFVAAVKAALDLGWIAWRQRRLRPRGA